MRLQMGSGMTRWNGVIGVYLALVIGAMWLVIMPSPASESTQTQPAQTVRAELRAAFPALEKVPAGSGQQAAPSPGEDGTKSSGAIDPIASSMSDTPQAADSFTKRAQPGDQRLAGIAPIGFDLRAPGASMAREDQREFVSAGMVEVRKPLFRGQDELGTLAVKIDSNARTLVDLSSLRALLEKAGVSAAPIDRMGAQENASLRTLRERGIDLRYDPIADRLSIKS